MSNKRELEKENKHLKRRLAEVKLLADAQRIMIWDLEKRLEEKETAE